MMSVPTDDFSANFSIADLGVDAMGECQHTRDLETYVADLFEKESALFFPTGVMANLCAVMAHTPKNQEVIVGRKSHIFAHEGGGVSILGGIPIKTIKDDTGLLDEHELSSNIGNGAFYSTKTGLICIENPHNDVAGIAHPPESLDIIDNIARENKIPLHLDGARIFNACAKFSVTPRAYASRVDSVMFCLNKGIRAPVGAVLVGANEFINQAKELRKLLGGELCQPGIISHMALNALRRGWTQLERDNDNAALLITLLNDNPNLSIEPKCKSTNIVYIYLKNTQKPAHQYTSEFEARGIKLLANDVAFRAVFHSQMSESDVVNISKAFNDII